MLNPGFGLPSVDDNGNIVEETYIDAFLNLARHYPQEVVRDGRVLRELLVENYDTSYNIFNHLAPEVERRRPLALVAMHPKEYIGQTLRGFHLKRRYVLARVREHSGMSWPEFVSRPRYEVEEWLEFCTELERKRTAANVAVENQVRESERDLRHLQQG